MKSNELIAGTYAIIWRRHYNHKSFKIGTVVKLIIFYKVPKKWSVEGSVSCTDRHTWAYENYPPTNLVRYMVYSDQLKPFNIERLGYAPWELCT